MVLYEKDYIECRLMWSEKLLFQNITEKSLFTAVCMMINKQDKKKTWIFTYERWKEILREINKKGFARYNIYSLRFSTKIRTYQNNNRWKPIISFFQSCFCPFVYFTRKVSSHRAIFTRFNLKNLICHLICHGLLKWKGFP